MADVVWHSHVVNRLERAELKEQRPVVLWFTGLSASGKSTIANALDNVLTQRKYHTYLLDGDNVRHGLCKDLGFSDEDRIENIRRVGEVSALMSDAGLIVLAAFISPFRMDRLIVKNLMPKRGFIEVHVDAPIEVCSERDPKGLYKKAYAGEIKFFTGVSSVYEEPTNPDIYINTSEMDVDDCVNCIMNHLDRMGILDA